MFHIYVTYKRFYKTAKCDELISEQYHIEEPDEKTTRKVSCALSGLLWQMSIDHDVNIVYEPDGRC
jgi:hypothetical protein